MALRDARYQGAIVREHCLLLIKHHFFASGNSYWLLPGGGQEDGESEEQAVRREMHEETGLEVRVERLLLEEPAPEGDRFYRRLKTYLCTPVGGEAGPGYEPEEDAAAAYAIAEVGWFDLRDPSSWDPQMVSDKITYPLVRRVRAALGYPQHRDQLAPHAASGSQK
jgi:ADP-ribose pyrophosphatase YjhB (NUDIX family)